jgi:hypothetical protein
MSLFYFDIFSLSGQVAFGVTSSDVIILADLVSPVSLVCLVA